MHDHVRAQLSLGRRCSSLQSRSLIASTGSGDGTTFGPIEFVVDERAQSAPDLQERGIVLVAWTRHVDFDECLDTAGTARDDDDIVGELDGFVDAVGHKYHGLRLAPPDAHKVGFAGDGAFGISMNEM